MKKLITILMAILLIGAFAIPFTALAEETSKVKTSLSGPSSIKQGDTITISYYADGKEVIFTYGRANIKYDSSDLQFISFTKAKIANWDIGYDNDGKRVQVWASDKGQGLNPIKDKKLIGTLKFKVLAKPGTKVTVSTSNLEFSSRGGASIPATTSSWSKTVADTQTGNSPDDGDDPKPGDGNSELQELDLGDISLFPEFDPQDPDQTDYVAELPEGTTEIDINAIPADNGSTVEIKGNKDLEKGLNIVQIVVTAKDGSQTVYTIAAIVGEEASSSISDAIAKWWWLLIVILIVILIVGMATGLLIDKFIFKSAKKDAETQEVRQ